MDEAISCDPEPIIRSEVETNTDQGRANTEDLSDSMPFENDQNPKPVRSKPLHRSPIYTRALSPLPSALPRLPSC